MLRRSVRPHRGFTLLEVLVVVAIITLLTAILFPVFARARGVSRRTSCTSNLKQLSLATFQYVQDYDDHFPLGLTTEGETPEGQPNFVVALDLVMPYLQSVQVAVCPSDDAEPDCDLMLPGAKPSSYTVNDQICNSPYLGGEPPVALAEIRGAVGMPLLWDAKNISTDPSNPDLQVAKRHFEGADVVFVDGHIKWMQNKPPVSDDEVHWNAKPSAE
jgi:prepilin-type N-terminal cleavage/methylation domain-containing protein